MARQKKTWKHMFGRATGVCGTGDSYKRVRFKGTAS